MRAAVAATLCLLVLAGSTVAVARTADTATAAEAAWRAKLIKALAEESQGKLDGGDCGCTAAIRAKDRVASRNTAEADASP